MDNNSVCLQLEGRIIYFDAPGQGVRSGSFFWHSVCPRAPLDVLEWVLGVRPAKLVLLSCYGNANRVDEAQAKEADAPCG